MRFKLRSLWLPVVFAAAQACTNVGFVDSAKAAANDEFGIDVFYASAGFVASNLILDPSNNFFTPDCSNIGGIDKANCICDANARQKASRGTYRAWLSISGQVDAICNIQGLVSDSCTVSPKLGPFFTRLNGFQILAEDYAELSTSGFRFPLDVTLDLNFFFTGTNAAGRATGNDCNGFSTTVSGNVTVGHRAKAGLGFTADQTVACPSSGTILCMRQSK